MTSVSSYALSQPVPLGNPEWVHARFDRAVDIVQSLPRSGPIQTNYDDKLYLYSMYKQATEGDIKGSRPGILDVLGRAKWDAWNKRKGMTQEEAERMYVHGLLKILKSFSDRTQAVELIRELETFSLDPRGNVLSGGETGSETTSTEGERRNVGPPAPASRPRHRVSASQRANPPSGQKQPRRGRGPTAAPASSVAPSLPGYGPPRTRADSPRRADSSTDDGDDDDSDYTGAYSSADDGQRRVPRRMPSGSGYNSQLQPPFQAQPSAHSHSRPSQLLSQQHYAASQQRHHTTSMAGRRVLSPPLEPRPFSPQQQSFGRGSQQLAPYGSEQAPLTPGSFRSALSPAPAPGSSGAGRAPSTASDAMLSAPAGTVGGTSGQGTSSSTLPRAVVPPTPTVQTNKALDAALDRIQTSLTALHERLTEVERSKLTLSAGRSGGGGGGSSGFRGSSLGGSGGSGLLRGGSSSPSGSALLEGGGQAQDSGWTLLRAVAVRLMILLRLRDRDQTSRSVLRVSWAGLVVRLLRVLIGFGRRVLGDLAVVIVVAGAVGRLTGTSDGVGDVLVRVVRALGQQTGARARRPAVQS